eukprot:SAG11_NODE_3657_length_2306_cov_1.110104_1_plen_247_part_00
MARHPLPRCRGSVDATPVASHPLTLPPPRAADLLYTGAITDETEVWAQGMPGWVQLGECRHLFRGLATAVAARSVRGSAVPPSGDAEEGQGRQSALGRRVRRAVSADLSEEAKEMKAAYAALIQKVLSGQASAEDGQEAERLGEALSAVEGQPPSSAAAQLDNAALAKVNKVAATCERCAFSNGDLIFEEGDKVWRARSSAVAAALAPLRPCAVPHGLNAPCAVSSRAGTVHLQLSQLSSYTSTTL